MFCAYRLRSDNNGAYNTVDIYDAETGEWNSTSTGAGSLSLARDAIAAASIDTKAIFAGGQCGAHCVQLTPSYLHRSWTLGAVNVVDIYDAQTGLWIHSATGAGSMGTARYLHLAAAIGTKAFFAGGVYASQHGMQLMHTHPGLQPSLGTTSITAALRCTTRRQGWSTLPQGLSEPRASGAAASVGTKAILLVARMHAYIAMNQSPPRYQAPMTSFSVAKSTVDIYDTATGKWNSTATGAGSLGVGRYDIAACTIGRLALFAGGLYGKL